MFKYILIVIEKQSCFQYHIFIVIYLRYLSKKKNCFVRGDKEFFFYDFFFFITLLNIV